MRKRNRTTLGFPASTLPTRIITASPETGEIVTNGSVYCPQEPAWASSHMTDEEPKERNKHFYHEVHHLGVRSSVRGYVPEWRPNFSQPYITFAVSSAAPIEYRRIEMPLMCVVAAGLEAFPELRIVPKVELILPLWFDYPNNVLSTKWKGPKLGLSSGFSLVNFALEWRESLRLAHSWFSKRELLERWHALLGRNQSLSARAKALANERLAHVYGTRLFLSDSFRLFQILKSWKERADRFLADANKLKAVKLPRANKLVVAESDIRSVPVFGATNSQMRVESRIEASVNATLGYTYTVEDMTSLIARVAQLSDTLGVKLTAGIVWDALPYTFIVDWFINVSEWLHRNYDYDWQKLELTIRDFCHSGKVVVDRSLVWTRDDFPGVSGTTQRSSLIYEDHTRYYRRQRAQAPELDESSLELSKDKWKVSRIINATSLIGQLLLKQRNLRKSASRRSTKVPKRIYSYKSALK